MEGKGQAPEKIRAGSHLPVLRRKTGYAEHPVDIPELKILPHRQQQAHFSSVKLVFLLKLFMITTQHNLQ